MSIINFIYKGEINIEQQHLSALLQAARTLQIRGLSDSVSTIDSELLKQKSDVLASKKRKVCDQSEDTNIEECPLSLDHDLIPKLEPTSDEMVIANVSGIVSDEDDIKIDSVENPPNLLPTDLGGSNGKLILNTSTECHFLLSRINIIKHDITWILILIS